MVFQWDFFENYNGSVYITDIDTNQLVYMNACLRHSLGFGDGEAYKGLKCYEVLQGKKEPCEFCTNQKIKEGKFISWLYHNPFLGKEFLLNDTLVQQDGKRYRVEIAMDLDKDSNSKALYYTRSEQILGECLQKMFSTADEDQAIDTLLQYIGETFSCERVYIFEVADQKKVNNTYEWCADGIAPQKEVLQNVPYDGVAFWFDIFDKEGVLSIADLEEIRDSYPLTYAYLQPQDIRSLMVGPIQEDSGYIGFIGADNPGKESIAMLSPLIRVIGYFVAVMLKRRDLTNMLRRQSQRDPLTGAFNRNALTRFFSEDLDVKSLGVVYCDISGLKQINDLYGHTAGDEMILQCYRLIASVMEDGQIYRIGGDEFLVTCPDMTQQDFQCQVDILRQRAVSEEYHIAVGETWTETFPTSFDELLKRADREMYRDKQQYYCDCAEEERRGRDRRRSGRSDVSVPEKSTGCPLPAWMTENPQACIYMGDYQSGRYYISDGMKNTFGFSDNIVHDFMSQWEEHIISYEQKQLFRKNIEQTLQEKKTTSDFSYTMQDGEGNIVLVRVSGLIQWDDTYTEPVTFVGSAQVEKGLFATDPITSLPMMQGAAKELERLKHSAPVLLFKLNHFGKINDAKGRDVGNQLLKNIAAELREHFREEASFFRLEGLKFMGILRSGRKLHQEFIDAVRGIVTKQYKDFEIALAESLTFIPIEYSNKKERPLDLIQNVPALISAAEHTPISRAIANSNAYLKEIKRDIDMEFALICDVQNQMVNFRVVVQPVVSARSKEILGGEVLLRWSFQGKDVSPGVFIPIIERAKLMGIVGKWVLEQTVQCCRSISVYRPDMYLAFNVSYQQILAYNFAETIRSTLNKYGINGKRIMAELTETHEDEAPIRLQNFIDACGEMGVRIALDDFGNGYSSLGLLLKYSAHTIKLDRSILQAMTTSYEKEKFVRGLVDSCHRLNKAVCVEGVETKEELAIATKVGCDIIQGFYFYKPLELNDLFREIIKECTIEALWSGEIAGLI